MTTNLSEWVKEVSATVPAVPDFLIERFAREAAIEFLKKTLLWQSTLTRISVVADTNSYSLTAPAGGEIWGIQTVKYKADGKDDDTFKTLDPVSEVYEDHHDHGNWEYTENETPNEYRFDHLDDTLYLYPTPTEASASGLLVKVNAIPDQSATYVQDFLYQKYKNAITYGAKALLLQEPNQPWSDIQTGLFNQAKFDTEISDAKTKRLTGFTNRKLRVRQRRFV